MLFRPFCDPILRKHAAGIPPVVGAIEAEALVSRRRREKQFVVASRWQQNEHRDSRSLAKAAAFRLCQKTRKRAALLAPFLQTQSSGLEERRRRKVYAQSSLDSPRVERKTFFFFFCTCLEKRNSKSER